MARSCGAVLQGSVPDDCASVAWFVCSTAYARANTATAIQTVATTLCLVNTGPVKLLVEGSALGVCMPQSQATCQILGSSSRQVVAGTHQSASSSGVVSLRLGWGLLPLRSHLFAQSGTHLDTQAGQTTLVLVLPRSGVHLQPVRRQTCCRNSVEQHQLLGQVSTFCSSSSMSLDSSDAIPLLPRAHPTPCA